MLDILFHLIFFLFYIILKLLLYLIVKILINITIPMVLHDLFFAIHNEYTAFKKYINILK